jgi:monoamine oxidase
VHCCAQASGDPALPLDHPLVVQWSRMPMRSEPRRAWRRMPDDAWRRLRAGVPPLFFAGDALSPLNGWQEGALESAQRAALALMRHARQSRTEPHRCYAAHSDLARVGPSYTVL